MFAKPHESSAACAVDEVEVSRYGDGAITGSWRRKNERVAEILVVEDDVTARAALGMLIAKQGYSVTQASDGVEGANLVRERHFDLVISDMSMPAGSGFTVLDAGLEARVPVVILTGNATVTLAVEAMKRGAADFLVKPYSVDSVASLLQQTFGTRGKRTTGTSSAIGRTAPQGVGIVGEDEGFLSVLEIVERVADTDATILITGESGTGKEVVARAIHNASRRAAASFVAVNCGAIPEALLESELFGHVRGAFTGATQARRGRFQLAEGGTLFLDEIGDMPASLQVKLLRVIQERRFEVLGDSKPQAANVRFVAATHRDLPKFVREERFREDLYYRLNVVPLHLPPLRERPRDVPLLVAHFIAEANAAHARTVDGISEEALGALCSYHWPGNIRELSNLVERMTLLRGTGRIEMQDVPQGVLAPATSKSGGAPQNIQIPEEGMDLTDALHRIEGLIIEQALARTRGNRSQAAALLRINRTTLLEKLRRREGNDSE